MLIIKKDLSFFFIKQGTAEERTTLIVPPNKA
jgi:hypothetical protein